ncbi:MAG: hypothetical protein ACI4XW_05790 [Candidatus Spyradocola sp.]
MRGFYEDAVQRGVYRNGVYQYEDDACGVLEIEPGSKPVVRFTASSLYHSMTIFDCFVGLDKYEACKRAADNFGEEVPAIQDEAQVFEWEDDKSADGYVQHFTMKVGKRYVESLELEIEFQDETPRGEAIRKMQGSVRECSNAEHANPSILQLEAGDGDIENYLYLMDCLGYDEVLDIDDLGFDVASWEDRRYSQSHDILVYYDGPKLIEISLMVEPTRYLSVEGIEAGMTEEEVLAALKERKYGSIEIQGEIGNLIHAEKTVENKVIGVDVDFDQSVASGGQVYQVWVMIQYK